MKIAVIGQHEWYGCMGTWVADGFEANGHEVTRIDRNNIVLDFTYDIAIFVDCSEDYSNNIPNLLMDTVSNKTGLKQPIKIFWSLDAHMPMGPERSVNIARKCDLVFSSNYEHGVKILEKFGIESYLMPVTYSDKYFDYPGTLGSRNSIRNDVVMIGHKNSQERVKLWGLLSKYKSFCGKAETELEYSGLMNGCGIVVNQPTEPWDNILNNRLFEGMAAGKLVLQKRLKTDLIEKLGFIDGEDFIYWDNFDDLKEKLDHYIGIEENVADGYHDYFDIAESGQQKVQQYSMKNQCAKIEAIVLSKFYDRL